MRSALALLVTVLVTALSLGEPPARRHEMLVGGIQVNEPDHERWFDGLGAAGLNTVAVTVYARQGDWDGANLWWDPIEVSVPSEIRRAKARGFRVVLVLRVALDHAFERNRFLWHGMIMPRRDDEVDEWFDRYERFVSSWATTSEALGVDVLAIGSEMNALASTGRIAELPVLEEYWTNGEKVERENARVLANAVDGVTGLRVRGAPDDETLRRYLAEYSAAHARWARQTAFLDAADPIAAINRRRRHIDRRWRLLIARSREIYRGELTYAANFDQFEEVTFWEELDLIGINAYFPLRDDWQPAFSPAEQRATLLCGWRAVLAGIDDFRDRRGLGSHDVLFTELGYVRRQNSSLRPWASDGFAVVPSASGERLLFWAEQPDDPDERAAALGALVEARRIGSADFLRGALYWKLSTLPQHRAIEPFVIVLDDPADAAVRRSLRELRPRSE